MSKFINYRLKNIVPYISPIKMLGINLNGNENPYAAYSSKNISINTNLYPYNILKLKERLSDIFQQPIGHLNLSCGLDDGINRIIRTYCEIDQDSMTIISPTFAFYKKAAQIHGIHLNEVAFDKNFEFPLEKLLNLQTKIIFICNPNNPSGHYIDLKNIEILCEKYKNKTIIAVDEAYIEFMQDESLSAINLLTKFDNLIVMRTMSKAAGLAGIRVGILISNKEIIDDLNKLTLPYPLPSPIIEISLSALSNVGMEYRRYNINYINFIKDEFIKAISESSQIVKIYPSSANFILIKVKNISETIMQLNTHDIYVKNLDNEIKNAMRMAIGTAEEMNKIISLFVSKEYLIPKLYYDFYVKNNIEILFLISPIDNGFNTCNIKEVIDIFNYINKQLNINIILIYNLSNKSQEEIVHYLAIVMAKFINKYSKKNKEIYLDFHICDDKNFSVIKLFFNAFNYAIGYNCEINHNDKEILQILTSYIKDILN